MNENIIAQINSEIATKLAEVAALQKARKALGGSNGSVGTPAAAKPAKSRERAPKGSLEKAMQAILEAKPGLTNQEVRAALASNGYEWAVSPLYVGKRLSRLVKKKKLVVKLDGAKRRYSLPK